jgi:hypothetical protein
MSNRLILLSLLCAGILALWLYHGIGTPFIANDSCQYLDAAANFASGRGLCIDLAHFDEQVAYHRFPIPFTHFAPGYPLLIAGLSRIGMAPEFAAWLISAVAFLATIWLMWDIGTGLGARQGVLALFVVLWITHASALTLASTAVTEPLFTALLLGMLALIVRDLRGSGRQPLLLPAIGITAAASYWVRYAGLSLIPVVLLYLIWRAWQTRATLRWAIFAGLATAISAAVIPLRNILHTGSWQGGFTAGGHSPRIIATESVKAWYHIVFGDRVIARVDGWSILAFVSLTTIAYLAFRAWRTEPAAAIPRRLPAAAAWTGALIVAYSGGIVFATLHSIAFDLARYYLPVYPVILTSFAAFSLAHERRQYVAVALLFTAIMAIQGRSLLVTGPSGADTMRTVLGEEADTGISMGEWLRANTRTGDSIVSVDGQVLHYLVQRPVVSIIEPTDSDRPIDEAAFQVLMHEFHARFLVVMADTSKFKAPEQEAIPFLRSVAAGKVPTWLAPASHTPDLAVFECLSCAAPTR